MLILTMFLIPVGIFLLGNCLIEGRLHLSAGSSHRSRTHQLHLSAHMAVQLLGYRLLVLPLALLPLQEVVEAANAQPGNSGAVRVTVQLLDRQLFRLQFLQNRIAGLHDGGEPRDGNATTATIRLLLAVAEHLDELVGLLGEPGERVRLCRDCIHTGSRRYVLLHNELDILTLGSDGRNHGGVSPGDSLPVHLREAVMELCDTLVDVQGPGRGGFGRNFGGVFAAANMGKEPSDGI